MILRASEVFKPQGTPTHTLVRETPDADSSQAFDDAVEETGKLIRVVGPSKSGKTVFVTSKATNEKIIRVSVSGIQRGHDLWCRVLANVDAAVGLTSSIQVGGTVGGEGKLAGEIGVWIAKAEVEASAKADISASRTVERTHAVDPLQEVVNTFKNKPFWIFIDDFHYASHEAQRELAEQIKFVAEENVQLIIALIPGRSEDILQKNSDLRGRLVDINFRYWSIEDLSQIAMVGFPLLGVKLDPGIAPMLANEAAGTPQLMQSICLELARDLNARETHNPPINVEIDSALIAQVCRRIASMKADYSTTLEQMRGGPSTRGTSRKNYPDAVGNKRDVYDLILTAFAMDPPQLKYTSGELQARVDSLAGEHVASLWESVRHMSEIANSVSSEIKIDFGGDLRWVSILDPYLFFALRWASS